MELDEVDIFIREHQDPGVGTREVADRFDATRRTALDRLRELEEQNRVRGKDLGGAIVWFPRA